MPTYATWLVTRHADYLQRGGTDAGRGNHHSATASVPRASGARAVC
jgi:hypothetical protein